MTVNKQVIVAHLIRQAATLYLFLITVGDARGLNYFSDKSLATRLSIDNSMLKQTRRDLVQLQLIAYQKPLYQVLALDHPRKPVIANDEPMSMVHKDWPEIFNNDATLTSAILDRLLHHVDTIVIEGDSYRMKEQIEI